MVTAVDGGREQVTLRGAGISQTQASVTIQPSKLVFGEVELSQRASKPVTLTHVGDGTVEIGRVSIIGSQANDYAIGRNGCQGLALAEGRRCIIEMIFSPGAQGSREATLIIADNSPAKEHTILLIGFGRAAAFARITVEPESIDFGAQALKSVTISARVVIRNSGATNVPMGQPTITGPDARHFSIEANSCSESLASEASCRITLRYVPISAGNHRAALRIEPRGSPPRELSLSGSGIVAQLPIASFSPLRLNFRKQPLRARAESQDITIQNKGTGELVILGVEIKGSGSFPFTNQCTGLLRDNRSTCTIRVGFSPATTGAHDAELLIRHNAGNSPQRISLSGFGAERTKPIIGVTPEAIQFGKQIIGNTSDSRSVTVTSTGSALLNIGGIRIEGPNPNDFVMRGNCTDRPVSPGNRCQISVSFAPKRPPTRAVEQTSLRTATLVIVHNAEGNTRRVSLNGTAIAKSSPPGILEGLKFNRDLRVLSTGWCCTNGNLQKATRTDGAEKNGTYFTDQRLADSQCRQQLLR